MPVPRKHDPPPPVVHYQTNQPGKTPTYACGEEYKRWTRRNPISGSYDKSEVTCGSCKKAPYFFR